MEDNMWVYMNPLPALQLAVAALLCFFSKQKLTLISCKGLYLYRSVKQKSVQWPAFEVLLL